LKALQRKIETLRTIQSKKDHELGGGRNGNLYGVFFGGLAIA